MAVATLLLLSTLLLLATHCNSQQCEAIFIKHPEDTVFDVNQTNVSLCCELNTTGFFRWDVRLTGRENSLDVGASMPDYNFEIDPTNGALIITSVQTFHQGVYACRIPNCPQPVRSNNATVSIRGPPMIKIEDSYSIDNGMELNFNGCIIGIPESTLVLYRVKDGVRQSVDTSRFHLMLIGFSFEISVSNPARADNGTYQLVADNGRGTDERNFDIIVIGPDPPIITFMPDSEVVSTFDSPVGITCSVPETAVDASLEMVWRGPMGQEVRETGTVFVTQMEAHSLTLQISTLQQNHTGVYMCTTTNVNSNDMGAATIYGPPRQVAMPTIADSQISWVRPTRGAPVDSFRLRVVREDTDESVADRTTDATEIAIGSLGLSSGRYEVSVAAISRGVEGERSDSAVFEVTSSFPVAIVAGAVGGALVLVALVTCCCAFFLCYWYPHKRRLTTQQQSWSKEDLETAPVNNYTTLTLHQPPELPPSPSSPLLSLFSADIDPKWEFPRENVHLSEVLYEGQYTILYKGTARGIKEQKTIEVAIKSVKDDATEDDVKSLVCEMELLASLGPHPNIVSLMRVCTVGKPLYMVLEYMCHGDLLGFLRASRGHYGMYTISPGIRNQPPCLHLSSRDLLSIAAKVANGMRFLADRKLAHRALCARNILVGTSMDIKIYNVGAFDMTFENRDTLVKWLSPETLFDGTATTYSDVWSFGVLLWELVTVGGTPYAEILPGDLYTQLYNGMRMPKPQHCAQEVYDIMRVCWERNPSDRPYFGIIQEQLEALEDSKLSFLDLRNYSEYDYSQFEEPPQLSTAL